MTIMTDRITLALPSKGAIAEPTINFLRDCGLRVDKPNPRQYTGSIPAIATVDVLFQRVKDVVYKVSDGTVHLGITGLDVVRENSHEDIIVIHDQLNYGHCELLVAVPESWVDVENMADVVDIALDFREFHHRNLRVATTYTNLSRQFLHSWGIHHFTLVKAEGAIEAAPTLGYADIVIDLTQTGTTLRENHLKPVSNGVIVESQACLIGNRRVLHNNATALETTRTMLEYIDAALQGRRYNQITVNICGSSAEDIASKVTNNAITRGLQGPTIAPIYAPHDKVISEDTNWFTVTVIVDNKHLLDAIEYLRSIGGMQSSVIPVRYIFLENSPTFKQFLSNL